MITYDDKASSPYAHALPRNSFAQRQPSNQPIYFCTSFQSVTLYYVENIQPHIEGGNWILCLLSVSIYGIVASSYSHSLQTN